MKSAGKARNNGLYRHIRTSKEIIRNLLNDFLKILIEVQYYTLTSMRDVRIMLSTVSGWVNSSRWAQSI